MVTKPIRSTADVPGLIANLRTHIGPPNGAKVILRFDDGFAETYTLAMPAMRDRGYVGVCPVITGSIGGTYSGAQMMTAAQLVALEAAGWEIASHGSAHVDNTGNLANFRADCDLSISQLVAAGVSYPQTYCYPLSLRNTNTDKEVYWRFGKCMVGGGAYVGLTKDIPTFMIPAGLFMDSTKAGIVNAAKRYVDHHMRTGQSVVLQFHRIVSGTPASGTAFALSDLISLLDWMLARGYATGLAKHTPAHNLIEDGGFERYGYGADGGLDATTSGVYPWRTSATYPASTSIDTINKHGGAQAAKLTVSVANQGGYWWQAVPVVPGKTYNLRAWIYAPTVTAGAINGNVEYYNPTNAKVGSTENKIFIGAANGAFTQSSATFTAPAGATFALIQFQGNSSFVGTFYLDDVSVSVSDALDFLA